MLVEHPTVGIHIHVTRGGQHLIYRHPIVAHTGRVNQYLILLDIAPQHGHLCHTARREQARSYGPVGQRT